MSRYSFAKCQNVYELYLDYQYPVLYVPVIDVFRIYGPKKSSKILIKKILLVLRKKTLPIIWKCNTLIAARMCETGLNWFEALNLDGNVDFEIHCSHRVTNKIYKSTDQNKKNLLVSHISSEDKIPVVIFAYNRPNLLGNLLETLKSAELQERFHYILFLDGARNVEDVPLINESRSIFDKFDVKNKSVIIRERNLGLHNSVISGMNSVFQSYDFAIVLEDDLDSNPSALVWFLNEALRLKGNWRYGALCGYFPSIFEDQSSENFDSSRFHSWGWATWKDIWDQTDFTQQNLLEKAMCDKFRSKLFKISPDLLPMAVGQLSGRISSWAIKFIVTGVELEHIYRFPSSSLINNNGFDETATHTHSRKLNVKNRKINSQNILEVERLVRAYYA